LNYDKNKAIDTSIEQTVKVNIDTVEPAALPEQKGLLKHSFTRFGEEFPAVDYLFLNLFPIISFRRRLGL
jgi:hypothetical protein